MCQFYHAVPRATGNHWGYLIPSPATCSRKGPSRKKGALDSAIVLLELKEQRQRPPHGPLQLQETGRKQPCLEHLPESRSRLMSCSAWYSQIGMPEFLVTSEEVLSAGSLLQELCRDRCTSLLTSKQQHCLC